MKIKKNWLQAKGSSRPWLQAPSTQRSEVPTEKPDTSPKPSLTNYQDNVEVLPELSHDNSSEDEYESGDQDSESDDLLANKLAKQILHKKLKDIKKSEQNKTSQSMRPAFKSQIIQPRGLTYFFPGLFSDCSSLVAAAVGAAFQ